MTVTWLPVSLEPLPVQLAPGTWDLLRGALETARSIVVSWRMTLRSSSPDISSVPRLCSFERARRNHYSAGCTKLNRDVGRQVEGLSPPDEEGHMLESEAILTRSVQRLGPWMKRITAK